MGEARLNMFVIFLIAVSLSMDAFSLAVSIGMLSLSNKAIIALSFTVGVFHFFMPLIGTILGHIFVNCVHADGNILAGIIFLYIAKEMFKEFKSEEESEFKVSIMGALVFALGVSLDSFGVGFALRLKGFDIVKSFSIFSIASFSFTYIGLKLGKIFNSVLGNYSILLGSIIMVLLSVLNFCHFLF